MSETHLRLTDNQRAQLNAVLKLIGECQEINEGMVVRLLEARGLMQDAVASRAEQLEDPEPLSDAETWSASDELEAQYEANLDDPRDFIHYEYQAIEEMGSEFFGDAWKEVAK